MFNVEDVRADFPILKEKVNGAPLIYLDNGATSQKPQRVIDCIERYYETYNANVHRGVHKLSQLATDDYEEARRVIQRYMNAKHEHEIIFTKGTTDSINLVASTFGNMLKKGDIVLVSEMEHHSNIVPWQMLETSKGIQVIPIPVNDKGELDMLAFDELLTDKVKLVSIVHISNALGTVNPIEEIIAKAHRKDIPVLVDGAQSVQHMPIDLQAMDCDFFTLSGHKLFGPTGVGVLYGKEKYLNAMPPYQGGGDMIKEVKFSGTTFNELPFKFEAGTPNIAGVIGLSEAFKYMETLPWEEIKVYEKELLDYATTQMAEIPEVEFVGTADNKASVISFNIKGLHHFDVGTLLDQQGVAVRTGHHCAQPVMDRFGIKGTIRASFAFYNTKEEIDTFVKALKRSIKMLS